MVWLQSRNNVKKLFKANNRNPVSWMRSFIRYWRLNDLNNQTFHTNLAQWVHPKQDKIGVPQFIG